MKRLIACLMLMLVCAVPTINAQSMEDEYEFKLRKGASLPGFDYTYVSPWMIKNMKQGDFSEFAVLPIKKVRHIEILKTKSGGYMSDFKSLMNKLADEPGFKLVGFNSNKGAGVKIYFEPYTEKDSDGCPVEKIRRLLVIQWANTGSAHSVFYVVGDFTPEELSGMLNMSPVR